MTWCAARWSCCQCAFGGHDHSRPMAAHASTCSDMLVLSGGMTTCCANLVTFQTCLRIRELPLCMQRVLRACAGRGVAAHPAVYGDQQRHHDRFPANTHSAVNDNSDDSAYTYQARVCPLLQVSLIGLWLIPGFFAIHYHWWTFLTVRSQGPMSP
jgi:hypothetical protein